MTAATSRARPTIESASPRFGLTSTSRTTSPYRSASGTPIGVSGRQDQDAVGVGGQAAARRPSRASRCSRRPSSRSARSGGRPAGRRRAGRPARAGRRRCWSRRRRSRAARRSPTVTRVSDSRSARGCFSTASSSPTTTLLPVGAPALDALDLHAEQRQPLGQLLGRQLDVDVLAQPATAAPSSELLQEPQVVLHVQPQVARRRGGGWRCRSTPIPNAKPW